MNRSELILRVCARLNHDLGEHDVELGVRAIIEQMCQALEGNGRIEIRDFGSFSLHRHPARTGRNPKTGEVVKVAAKWVPHFKPGKGLRERVDASRLKILIR